MTELLFEASRLSAWGMGLMLVYVALSRVWNSWRWRVAGARVFRFTIPAPATRYGPPRAAQGSPTTFFAALLGLIPLFAFTPAIVARHVAWLEIGVLPWTALVSVWLLSATIGFLLWKLAFRPMRKMAISSGWVALSHCIVWLQNAGA